MRLAATAALVLVLTASGARAQSVPPAPERTGVAAKKVDDQKADLEAIANCEQMWDRGTHMTKREWSLTCRRVQYRLRQIPPR